MLLLRLHRYSSDWDWDLLYHLFYLQYLRVCVYMKMRACANSRMSKRASVWWAEGAIHDASVHVRQEIVASKRASIESCKRAHTCEGGSHISLSPSLPSSLPLRPSLPPSLPLPLSFSPTAFSRFLILSVRFLCTCEHGRACTCLTSIRSGCMRKGTGTS